MSLSLNNIPAASARCPLPKWAARLGALAFLFFLVKGLAWLAVGTVVAWAAVGVGTDKNESVVAGTTAGPAGDATP